MTRARSASDQLVNLPNMITVARLLLLAPVCWLLLAPTPDGVAWALAPMLLLGIWASTDWADGYLARRLHQVTRLGTRLDPIADRIGIVVVVAALVISGALPWWLLAVIVAVDLVTVMVAGSAAKHGSISVSWPGKVRTALLLLGIVTAVIGAGLQDLESAAAPTVLRCGWWLAVAGTAGHVIAGVDYLRRARLARR